MRGRTFALSQKELQRVSAISSCVKGRHGVRQSRPLSHFRMRCVCETSRSLWWLMLSQHLGMVAGSKMRNPLTASSPHPLLKRLELPKAGLHAFRHSRVTTLRKYGTPANLQKQWIGHSSLRTTDRYSHTHQELEHRRLAASKVGLNFVVGPNGPKIGECVAE